MAKKMEIKVELQNLFTEAANDCHVPAISIGFAIAHKSIGAITYRVIELLKEGVIEADDVLIRELKRISYLVPKEDKDE